jgi:hypothetical protein
MSGRRVIVRHTTGSLAGLRRIVGTIDATVFPAELPKVEFGGYVGPVRLRAVEDRYVLFEEIPCSPNAPAA